MATRAPRTPAEKASQGPTAIEPATTALPAVWGPAEDIEEFNGHDLTEKKELVGVLFLIIGIEIERNETRGYDVGYVYALDEFGTEFEFSDSSTTGILPQLQALLVEKGLDPAPGAGFQKLRVVVRKGLRVSEFEIIDPETRKKRSVSTYYLSAMGRMKG